MSATLMSWGCFINLECSVFIKYTTSETDSEPVRSHLELCHLSTGSHCGSHSRMLEWKSLKKEPVRQMRVDYNRKAAAAHMLKCSDH